MTIHQVIVLAGTAAAVATVAPAVAAARSAASRLFIPISNFPIQALSIPEDMKLLWINFNGMYSIIIRVVEFSREGYKIR